MSFVEVKPWDANLSGSNGLDSSAHELLGQSKQGGSMQRAMGSHSSQAMQECIQACTDCHNICIETAAYCLQQGGKHAEASHIRTLLDCAEICQTSANFMLRGSLLHGRTCGVCAELCEACAQSCAPMGDDAQMQACAQICRRCAESCRRMAA
jgi:hypothetical protein